MIYTTFDIGDRYPLLVGADEIRECYMGSHGGTVVRLIDGTVLNTGYKEDEFINMMKGMNVF